MKSTRLALLFALLTLAPMPGCKYVEELTGTKTPEPKKSCVEDVKRADEQDFGLRGDLNTQVRAALVGTVHLRELTSKIGKEVAEACAAIGRELGESKLSPDDKLEPAERAVDVCGDVAKLIKKKRDDDGVVLLLYPHAPTCSVSLHDFSSCLKQCDLGLAGGDGAGASCDPETESGRCEAKCTGTCVQSFTDDCAGTCRGVCRGGCDEEFYGKCGGRCIGTCHGEEKAGKCEGICDGKCTSEANGSCQGMCKGKCSGACLADLKKRECPGTCRGSCSENMTAQHCGRALAPAEMTPACTAMCEAKLTRELRCVAGYADVMVYNSTKEGAGAKMKAALDRRLDVLVGAEEGMKEAIDRAHEGIANTFSSIDETFASDKKSKQKAGVCVDEARQVRERAAEDIGAIREAITVLLTSVKG